MDWKAMAVLPNVRMAVPIEGGLVAVAGHDDQRVQELRQSCKIFDRFIDSFTDAFGRRIEPAVLLVRTGATQELFKVDAIASFRDAVAISAVAYNRAFGLIYRRGHRICFSNSFWIYPWMFDRYNEDMILETPAMLAVDEPDAFRGQSAPELPHISLTESDIDQPLLEDLLGRWRRRYAGRKTACSGRTLFRSLNMANQAAQLPGGIDTTFYDVGRMLALWVSAFEILAHPGVGRSDLKSVYGLLDKIDWILPSARMRRFKAYERGRQTNHRRTIACRLYGEIYHARNAFLHGEPVARRDLVVKPANRSLLEYAAPLYRMALTGFLQLSSPTAPPSLQDAQRFGEEIAKRLDFESYQKITEKALLTARGRT
jgi:hypothetical protein